MDLDLQSLISLLSRPRASLPVLALRDPQNVRPWELYLHISVKPEDGEERTYIRAPSRGQNWYVAKDSHHWLQFEVVEPGTDQGVNSDVRVRFASPRIPFMQWLPGDNGVGVLLVVLDDSLTLFEQLHYVVSAALEEEEDASGPASSVFRFPLARTAEREGLSVSVVRDEWMRNGLLDALQDLGFRRQGDMEQPVIAVDMSNRRTYFQKAADECLSYIDTIWTVRRIQRDTVSPHVAALYDQMDWSPQNMRIRAMIGGVAQSASASLFDAEAHFRRLLVHLSSTAADERQAAAEAGGAGAAMQDDADDVLREAQAQTAALNAMTMSGSHSEWETGREDATPVGLRNIGNTCYLNAVLQSLFHLPWFRNWMLQADFAGREDHANEVQHDPAASEDDKLRARKYLRNVAIAKALRALFACLARSSRTAYVPAILVRDIAGLLGANENRVSVGSAAADGAATIADFLQQQDAAEFQEWLVTKLELAIKGMDAVSLDEQSQTGQPTGHQPVNPSHGRVVSMQEALDSSEPLTELFTVRSVHLRRLLAENEEPAEPAPLRRSASGGAVALEENSFFLRLSLGSCHVPLTANQIPADAIPRGGSSVQPGDRVSIPRAYGLYPMDQCHMYTSLNRLIGWEESDAEAFSHTRTELTSLPPVLTCALGRADMSGELIKHSFPLEERLFLDDYVAGTVGDDSASARRVWTETGRLAVRAAQRDLLHADQRKKECQQGQEDAEARLEAVLTDSGADDQAEEVLEQRIVETTGAVEEARSSLDTAEEAWHRARQRVLDAYEAHSVARYVVRSVVVFQGTTPHGGHFFTYVREPSGMWLLLNDATVRAAVPAESVRTVCEGGPSERERVFMITYVREQDLDRFHQYAEECMQQAAAAEMDSDPTSDDDLWGRPGLYPPLYSSQVSRLLEQQVADDDRQAKTEMLHRLTSIRDAYISTQVTYIRRRYTSVAGAKRVRQHIIKNLGTVPARARKLLRDQVTARIPERLGQSNLSEQERAEELVLQRAVCDSMFTAVDLVEGGESTANAINVTERMLQSSIEAVRAGDLGAAAASGAVGGTASRQAETETKLAPADVCEDAFQRMSILLPGERSLVRMLRKLPALCRSHRHLIEVDGADRKRYYLLSDEQYRLLRLGGAANCVLPGPAYPSKDAARRADCEEEILVWIEQEREKKGMGMDVLTRGPLSRSPHDTATPVWCILPSSVAAQVSLSASIDAQLVRPLSDEELAAVQRWHRTRNHPWGDRCSPEIRIPQGATVQFLEDHFGTPGGPNGSFSLDDYGVWSAMEREQNVSVVGMPQPAEAYMSEEEMIRMAIEESMREIDGYRGGKAQITQLDDDE